MQEPEIRYGCCGNLGPEAIGDNHHTNAEQEPSFHERKVVSFVLACKGYRNSINKYLRRAFGTELCVMFLYVKNMVCERCIMAVRQALQQLGLGYHHVQLGEIELAKAPSREQLSALSNALSAIGFELLDDKKARTVEKIKTTIVSLIHRNEDGSNLKLSAFLEDKIGLDYTYLSTLFSAVEGITIEKYSILQRIEKVKELLVYDELSLSEIADQLGYSSVQHLSIQFKKMTGLTASQFRNLKEKRRTPLDKI